MPDIKENVLTGIPFSSKASNAPRIIESSTSHKSTNLFKSLAKKVKPIMRILVSFTVIGAVFLAYVSAEEDSLVRNNRIVQCACFLFFRCDVAMRVAHVPRSMSNPLHRFDSPTH